MGSCLLAGKWLAILIVFISPVCSYSKFQILFHCQHLCVTPSYCYRFITIFGIGLYVLKVFNAIKFMDLISADAGKLGSVACVHSSAF